MPVSNMTFGFTQLEIANRSGLHQSHISKYLSGKSMPTLMNIKKISDACNLPLSVVSEYLLEKYNEKNAG